MTINTVEDFHEALKAGPYAWPGGYPLHFITSDGGVLSFESAKANIQEIEEAIADDFSDGWRVVCMDVNWEDSQLYCDHSGKRIESAYAED